MILTTEYQVVTGKSGLKDLESKVSELVKKGWLPTGGIAFNLGYPYQAMTKETTKLKERDTNAPLEQNPPKSKDASKEKPNPVNPISTADAMKLLEDGI